MKQDTWFMLQFIFGQITLFFKQLGVEIGRILICCDFGPSLTLSTPIFHNENNELPFNHN